MATLSLTIVPGKALKDGKHKVRIAVAHNSQTRYILTDVIINSTKEWKNGKVVKRGDSTYLNSKLLARIDEVQRIIDETPYIEGLSCAELVTCILHARKKKTHTLRTAFDEMLEVSSSKETVMVPGVSVMEFASKTRNTGDFIFVRKVTKTGSLSYFDVKIIFIVSKLAFIISQINTKRYPTIKIAYCII